MKAENPYLKILKERYLSLIVAPIVIVGGVFYYFHIAGILFWNELEIITIFPLFGIPIFLFIQALIVVRHLLYKNFPEAFGSLIRLVLVIMIVMLYKMYFMPHLTSKIEDFEKERQYYLRTMLLSRSFISDGKGKLKVFALTGKEGTSKCGVVYDESDTLLNDSHHRGIGNNWKLLQDSWYQLSPPIHLIGKIYMIATDGYKIEPKFYYMCFDFDKKIEIENDKTKEKK